MCEKIVNRQIVIMVFLFIVVLSITSGTKFGQFIVSLPPIMTGTAMN